MTTTDVVLIQDLFSSILISKKVIQIFLIENLFTSLWYHYQINSYKMCWLESNMRMSWLFGRFSWSWELACLS